MCWNAETSFVTWIFVVLVSVYLWKRNHEYDRTIVFLLLTYSSIQLWEGILWLNKGTNSTCNSMNKLATFMIYITLWAHLAGFGAGLWYEKKISSVLILGLIFIAIGLFLMPTFICSENIKASTGSGSTGSTTGTTITGSCGYNSWMSWGFNSSFYFYVFIMLIICILYYVKPLHKSILMLLPIVMSIIVTLIYTNGVFTYSSKTAPSSSYWCWIGAVAAVLWIFMNK